MKKPLTFICRQKINFILHISLEILQKCCKLVVLGNLSMPGYAQPKWYYQLVKKFHSYLHANLWGTLGMPGCTLPKWKHQLVRKVHVYLHAKNKLHPFTSFLRYYILKNPENWLADSILAHNSRSRILPDVGLVVKFLSVVRYSNYLLLCQKSEKTNEPFLRKMPNWQMDRRTD